MSRSIHTTYKKNIRGLTKKEIIGQFNDPDSDLAALAKKALIKEDVKKKRKQKSPNKLKTITTINQIVI